MLLHGFEGNGYREAFLVTPHGDRYLIADLVFLEGRHQGID